MDVIFNGFWHKYIHALAAIPVYDWNLWNLMSSRVFPKVAKCEMFFYGPSGTPNVLDVLCVLPLNILNEKLFALLYVWFLFIAMLASINILYRLVLMCCPELRLQLLRTHLRGMPKSHVRQVLADSGYGDWFVLMSVSINVNQTLFRDLLEKLYQEVQMSKLKPEARIARFRNEVDDDDDDDEEGEEGDDNDDSSTVISLTSINQAAQAMPHLNPIGRRFRHESHA